MESLPEIGDVIDDTYELVSVLGTGGFGAVYRARQLNIDRDVALKLLIASGPKFEEMVKRFRREVMAIRNLTHPNTVRIYDFRDNPEGLLYYTMEALEGQTLKEEVRENGPFSPQRLYRVLRQVLKSLSEAHAYGIVHRDLKPSNIMLVDMHGETDFVKVLDFGIAKMLHDQGEGEEDSQFEELTSAGILVGTLRYMAPEQIADKELGPHTDLYSLGLIAVEMLSGQTVFSGSGRFEVLQQQVSDEPLEVPQVVLDSGLGAVISKCLEKDRARRFSVADEVLEAINGIDISTLSAQPLFISDGQGQWVARDGSGAVRNDESDLDAMNTVMIEEVFDSGDTQLTPMPQRAEEIGAGGVDDYDGATELTESPFAENPGATVEMEAAGPSIHQWDEDRHDDRNKASGREAQAKRVSAPTSQPRSTSPDETGKLGDGDSGFDDQLAELGANKFSPSYSASGKNSGKKKVLIAAVVGLLAVLGGGAFLVMGEADDESTDDELQAQEAIDDGGEAEAVDEGADGDLPADDDDEAELHIVEIGVENEAVVADVYVDDERRGQTPYVLEFEEEHVLVRLEADDYEPVEALFDRQTRPEVEVELVALEEEDEASDEAEEDEADAVADRGASGAGDSADASGSSPQQDPGRRQASPEPEPEPEPEPAEEEEEDDWVDLPADEPEEEEEAAAEEVAEEEEDDWVDIGGDEEEEPEEAQEEEEDDEIPLF